MDRLSDTVDAEQLGLAGRLAHLAGQVMLELPQRLHPAWVESLEVPPALLSATDPGLLTAALQARFDLCWPDLSAADHPLEWAWLLPPADLFRLCAARALFSARASLARTLEAGLRRAVRALVGSDAFDALLSVPAGRRHDTVPSSFDGQAVITAGWSLLKRELPWRDARSRRLVDLTLPPVPPLQHLMEQFSREASSEHDTFSAELGHLFPEHAWLFGSRPASLTSA